MDSKDKDQRFLLMLEEIPDPRYDRCKLHRLSHVIYMAIFGWLCGAKNWIDVWDYCDIRKDFLIQRLGLLNGIPSVSTFRRCLAHVSYAMLSRLLIRQADAISPTLDGKLVAIDGKSLRGSASPASGQRAFHALNAFCTDTQTVLRQIFGDCKEAESTMVHDLLDTLDVKGATVTIDAMGCQASITEAIIAQKADYLIGLKKNQPNAFCDVEQLFAMQDIDADHWEETNKGHGRLEIRSCLSIDVKKYALPSLDKFAGIRSITRVNSIVERNGEQTQEYRYYISSRKAVAKEIGEIIRAHWSIENSLHYVLDVVFDEDDSTIRQKTLAANTALIRKICLNIIHDKKGDNEKNKKVMLKALVDPYFADSLISQIALFR